MNAVRMLRKKRQKEIGNMIKMLGRMWIYMLQFTPSGITTTQGTVDSSSTSKNIIVNVGDILPSGIVTIKIPATVIK